MRERDFGPAALHLLQSCCEAMDLADQAGQVLREQGLTYTGRRGGTHLRPEFRIERSAQAFVLKALHVLMQPNKQRSERRDRSALGVTWRDL